MATVEDLLKEIGRPYQMLFDDNTYCGCFYPMYYLYDFIPHFVMEKPEDAFYENCIDEFYNHCIEIPKDELKKGDLIAINFKNILHVAVYYEFGKIVHIFNGRSLELGRLKSFKEYKCFRVKQ